MNMLLPSSILKPSKTKISKQPSVFLRYRLLGSLPQNFWGDEFIFENLPKLPPTNAEKGKCSNMEP
jgi:hypothetical protein